MYTPQELEDHLRRFTDAWRRYTGSWNNPSQLLDHLEACWSCNQELDWFYSHKLKLWRDIEWNTPLQTFVLTEITIRTTRTIYIASSVSLFDTPEYKDIKALIERNYPHDTLIFAKGLYSGSQEWLTKWPQISKTVDVLLFFTHDGWIGKGVYKELCDIEKRGQTIFFVEPDGTHHQLSSIPVDIDFTQSTVDGITFEFNTASWRQYAHVSVSKSL